MTLFKESERRFAEAVADVAFCNPFLPERVEYERRALGSDFSPVEDDMLVRPVGPDFVHPNVSFLTARSGALVEKLSKRLADGASLDEGEATLYEELVAFYLYHRFYHELDVAIREAAAKGAGKRRIRIYPEFRELYFRFLAAPGLPPPTEGEANHLFACLFQARRAFHHIYQYIIGRSRPAARLRASAWQSIFTRDMRRYRRALTDKMGDVSCLIVGPSGTGKELVARAVGMSRFIPFDAKAESFAEGFAEGFHALHLSALSPTLIESELFGHRKGAFTGALNDRAGWLEQCTARGTVFLDEIGEIDGTLQVKLLRAIQFRVFQRLGDTEDRPFRGKIIAATNRDLAEEMRAGRFREDFYYRICSDIIHTPSLREQLADSPDAIVDMLRFIAGRLVGEGAEGEALAAEARTWIETKLGPDYAWPGNFRELEQCARNIVIRGEYHPPKARSKGEIDSGVFAGAEEGKLTAAELLGRYCTLVYAQAGSYQEAARRLDMDHRAVKAKIDEKLLARLKRRAPEA